MLVVGPVAGEHQDASIGKRIDDGVEDRMSLRIRSVQVLEREDDRLSLTLRHQQAPDAVDGPGPAQQRIQRRPLRIVDGNVKQREEGGNQ